MRCIFRNLIKSELQGKCGLCWIHTIEIDFFR